MAATPKRRPATPPPRPSGGVSGGSRDPALGALPPAVRIGLPSSGATDRQAVDELMLATDSVDWGDRPLAQALTRTLACSGDARLLERAWSTSGARVDLEAAVLTSALFGLLDAMRWAFGKLAESGAAIDANLLRAAWVSAMWFPAQNACVLRSLVDYFGRDWMTGDMLACARLALGTD